MKGIVHSFQSLSAVDGPGLRVVIFMQGCSLRCIYCHNPETWSLVGTEYEVEEIFDKILRFKGYFKEQGGVTISGGEPLLQWEFVAALFQKLRVAGIHTALDTSGVGNLEGAREVLKYTDLVICDLKFSTDEEYLRNARADMKGVLAFLDEAEKCGVPSWIRHVVVPGITDGKDSLRKIVEIASGYNNLDKLEFLPFRKFCLSKYESLNIPFPLKNFRECSDATIDELTSWAAIENLTRS